jgi:uncharacterized membrane protein
MFSDAFAVNGDGTVIGGYASVGVSNENAVPVRWQKVVGGWVIEQLDSRSGRAAGANATGDLAGSVHVPCQSLDGCQRAVIWYAVGGSPRELPTLGGKDSWARDINAAGEVVGGSTSPTVGNTGFFWSASTGMFQLPHKGRWAMANALSDVRPDGSRVVVGTNAQARAWCGSFGPHNEVQHRPFTRSRQQPRKAGRRSTPALQGPVATAATFG